jgi:predicted ribosomally synthesized peptide with nif11-like leader
MSLETCHKFFAEINTDTALQQEVNAALEGKEGEEAATALAWVGAKHGYEFTTEEASQKYQEILAAAASELDEEALDRVAGGITYCMLCRCSGTTPQSNGVGSGCASMCQLSCAVCA